MGLMSGTSSLTLLNGKDASGIWNYSGADVDWFYWFLYLGIYNLDVSGDGYPDIVGIAQGTLSSKDNMTFSLAAINGRSGTETWSKDITQNIKGYDGNGMQVTAIPAGDVTDDGVMDITVVSTVNTTGGYKAHDENYILSGIDGVQIWNASADIESTGAAYVGLSTVG
jgi:hypothetical protein